MGTTRQLELSVFARLNDEESLQEEAWLEGASLFCEQRIIGYDVLNMPLGKHARIYTDDLASGLKWQIIY